MRLRRGILVWGRRAAGALALLVLAGVPAARACSDFHAAPSSRWSIASTPNGPELRTPCGDPFFSLGVNSVDGGLTSGAGATHAYRWERFAASRAEWAAATRRQLLDWGFNTAGAWSLPATELDLPSTPELELGRSVDFVWTDPFDPATADAVRHAAVAAVAPYRGNPLRIGYFSDNEIGWWNGPVFMAYLAYPRQNHTKARLVALLRERYRNNWQGFVRDFVPAPGTASFADVLASRVPPHLRPGGHGIAVVRAWTAVLAARYYAVMRDALRAADPDALYLGDRLPIYYDPDAVRAMAPYVDAISVNYNVDVADGWIARYFFDALSRLSGGKPVLITEWFYAAAENRSSNRNRTGQPRNQADARISNNRNRTGHLMTVATQAERVQGASRAARLLAAVPNAIGVHWFQYADEPTGGRIDGEDYDFGLVDIDDHPYRRLVAALRDANRAAPLPAGRAAAVDPAPRPEPVLPWADIDPAAENLVDWPKAASLLTMTPAPSEVPFGDIYDAWSERGLYLATIAMDYYDPSLLGTPRPLPRSEAFRIALGVDAGAGPRRIELRVVPEDVVHTARDETKLTFAAEVCRYGTGDGCSAVPGAGVRYFGTALDQPRVILKAFVPWSALGLPGPPRDAALRLALGVTAFYRSRWMSTNGAAPDVAMAHPQTWRRVILGGAAPDWLTPLSARTAAERSN